MLGTYLSLLQSTSEKPLQYWSKEKSLTGSIKRVLDGELNEYVLDLQDREEGNSQKTWIMCPSDTNQLLRITFPILIIILKSTFKSFNIQLQLVDQENIKHLINFSNGEQKYINNVLKGKLILDPGWNKVEIDLHFLSKILETQFKALTRIRITANCRIKKIYFLDKHYNEYELSRKSYQRLS